MQQTVAVTAGARLARWAASESYLILLVCGAAALMLLGIGVFVMSDTWLALVAGRQVAMSGPPSVDVLTTATLGRDWVDQQWLGQLALYEIWRAGGLALLGVVHAGVVIATFAGTLAGARRRGGSPRHVALVGLLAVLPIGLIAGNIRAQTFALALFVLVLWLLSQDSRAPSGRVFWTIPLLVLWANVHGSVLVGVGLVALGGALAAASGRRAGRPRALGRGALLVACALASPFATPYGPAVLSYFGDLLGNSEIREISSEWMAPGLELVNAPFFVLAALTLALVAFERRRLTAFEWVALFALLLGALAASRNLAWFAFAAVLLLPPALTHRRPPPDGRIAPIGLACVVAVAALAATAIALLTGVGDAQRQADSRFPPAAGALVARLAGSDRHLMVFAHPRYADWLLFEHPGLAGRVALDIRFELLDASELRRFRRVRDRIGADWRDALGQARLVLLDSSEQPPGGRAPTSAVLRRDPGARQLYAAHDVALILRP